MSDQQFSQYVADRYLAQIQWYDKKAAINQKGHRWLQGIVVCLSAVTPVLAMTNVKWLTVTAATLVAIATGLSRLFKFEENWISYRTTCELLKKEQYSYEFRIGDYADESCPEALFVQRIEELVSRENTFWSTAHSKESRSQGSTKDE